MSQRAKLTPCPAALSNFQINSPYLFSTVWSLVKPWLDEVTVKKISIPGRDWKTQLLAQIEPENLEVKLGGKSTDPSTSDAGPWTTDAGRKGQFDILIPSYPRFGSRLVEDRSQTRRGDAAGAARHRTYELGR